MCQKKKRNEKKTMQEQLNPTPKSEDFNKETGSSIKPSWEPAGLPSHGIALCKKNKIKKLNNPPQSRLEAETKAVGRWLSPTIVFFNFFITVGRPCTCPAASAGWSTADWRSFLSVSAVLTQTFFFLINFFFLLSFVCFGSQWTNLFIYFVYFFLYPPAEFLILVETC
jgi:hypothetical protein